MFDKELTLKFLRYLLEEVEGSTDEKPNMLDIKIDDIDISSLNPTEIIGHRQYIVNIIEPEYKIHITLNPKQYVKFWRDSPPGVKSVGGDYILYMNNDREGSKIMKADKIK